MYMPTIIPVQSPYILDTTEEGVVALTRKNADFIEAVVRLDSNYGKDLERVEPHKRFDPLKDFKGSKYFCGSTAYWFDEMKNGRSFEQCVLGAIIAIDRINSTHLEASVDGRMTMKKRICAHCKNVADLRSMLNTSFHANDPKHLISILTDRVEAVKGGYRFNISFATKFCAYASQFLNTDVQYAKYDNVVSNRLPEYMNIYFGENKKKRSYKTNSDNTLTEQQKFEDRLNVYEKYSADIERLIYHLKEEGVTITVEEFDHIIWYANKG